MDRMTMILLTIVRIQSDSFAGCTQHKLGPALLPLATVSLGLLRAHAQVSSSPGER